MICSSALYHAFEVQALRIPDAVAVASEARGQVSYGRLRDEAGALARRLRALGVRPETPVALLTDRSPQMVVALLGILRSGGAYLPLDPAFPESRLAFMLDDAWQAESNRVLLTQGALAERFPTLAARVGTVVDLDRAFDSGPVEAEDMSSTVQDGELAYLLYTSGSTGTPKGVQIENRAAAAFLQAIAERLAPSSEDVLAAVTTLSFDISVLEIFLPLATGGRLVLVEGDLAWDGLRLGGLLERQGCTIMQATPTTWRLLLEGGSGLGLRAILSGGEALPPDVADGLLATGAAVWNLYGPTEATVWVTAHRLESPGERPPIGTALGHARLHLLDGGLQPVPNGDLGEVYASGPCLARGYRGRPSLTAERFLPNPFAGDGARLYRIGDLARRRPDGTLDFAGRVDQQVKVRGFRIELGEIEAALARHPAVRQNAVAVHETRAGDPRLVAYLVLEPGQHPSAGELREMLSERLADYMVPRSFVYLDTLSLTPNGKVDRKRLPAPGHDRPELQAPYVEPRGEAERILVEIWQEVLGLDRIGVRDDFFDLGGHSLLALHVVARMRQRLGCELPPAVVLEAPTVEELATHLDGRAAAARDGMPLVLMGGRSSTRRPFFCVHGMGGNVFRLVQLARRVRRPFYGIQGWAEPGQADHLTRVESMAERYLAHVRRLQPEGPYLLGGICHGFAVALEMALRLQAGGASVAFLAALNVGLQDFEFDRDDGEERVPIEVFLIRDLGVPVPVERLLEVPAEERLPAVIDAARRGGILPEGFGREDALHHVDLFRRNFEAFRSYRMVPGPVRVTLFSAAEEAVQGPPTRGWESFARRGVEVIEVPGDNASMLRTPQVEVLAWRFAEALDAAERTPSQADESDPVFVY